jgi:hypothetical protein
MAAASSSPPGTVAAGTSPWSAAPVSGPAPGPALGPAVDPTTRAIRARAMRATALIRLVACWAASPIRIPRHWSSANATTTPAAVRDSWPARGATRGPEYSPRTMATAATLPQVASQSVQPTTNPGYGPSPRRARG